MALHSDRGMRVVRGAFCEDHAGLLRSHLLARVDVESRLFGSICEDGGQVPPRAPSPEYAELRKAQVVAVECGNGSPTSDVWIQLYRLVEAKRLDELRALASSHSPERRVS
jgi:hypothetical protein